MKPSTQMQENDKETVHPKRSGRMAQVRMTLNILALSVMIGILGCSKGGEEDMSEAGQPTSGQAYIDAQNRVKERDYTGAIKAYEAELRKYPRNAQAHLEVAILHQKRTYDFAAAIYHFEKFKELEPESDSEESVNKSIESCKMAIASTVEMEPNSFAMQKHVTELTRTNEKNAKTIESLKQTNADLTGDISRLTAEIAKLASEIQRIKQQGAMEYAKSLSEGTASAQSGISQDFIDSIVEKYTEQYTVQQGDSYWKIAKMHNIGVPLLEAANPDKSARTIRPGDVMNIPKKPE